MDEKLADKIAFLDSLHQQACSEGKNFYVDPETSRMYFTEPYLRKRGYCCHTGCRHCPYPAKEEQTMVGRTNDESSFEPEEPEEET